MSTINLNSPPSVFQKVSPSSNQDNYNLNGDLFLINSSIPITISGFSIKGNGHLLSFTNVGSNSVTFLHQSTLSSVNNRIALSGSSPTSFELTAGNTIQFRYDGFDKVWRLWGDTGFVSQNIVVSNPGARQTAISGSVNSNGYPNYLTASGSNNVNINGSTTPVVMSIADGFSNTGMAVDRFISYTGNQNAWTNLPLNSVTYLYADYNVGTGALTFGTADVEPIYRNTFKSSRNSLLHCEGTNGSHLNILDDYGNVWKSAREYTGNNALTGTIHSTAQSRFGTSSIRITDAQGSVGYIVSEDVEILSEVWCVEMYVRLTAYNTNMSCVFSQLPCTQGYALPNQVQWYIGTGGRLVLYLTSNGTSWDIANGVQSTGTVPLNTWTHVRLSYDGTTYRMFINGVIDGTVVSNLRVASLSSGGTNKCITTIGNVQSNTIYGLVGFVDEIRITTRGHRETANFSAPASPFTMDAHWFNTNSYEMFFGGPGSWTKVRRLFLGEVQTNNSSITKVTNYAYNARTESPWIYVVGGSGTGTTYDIEHNISADHQEGQMEYTPFYSVEIQKNNVAQTDGLFWDNGYGVSFTSLATKRDKSKSKNFMTIRFGYYVSSLQYISGYIKITFRRSW